MTEEKRGFWLGWALIALAAALAFGLTATSWKLDLSALWIAPQFVGGDPGLVYLPGPEVYVAAPPADWAALAEAAGHGGEILTPYLYPPLWAVVLAPLARALPPLVFMGLIQALNLAALAATIWLGFRLAGGRRFLPWAAAGVALAATSAPGYLTIWLGQPQAIVGALIVWAFVRLGRGGEISAGALLALAAAIKLGPALLAVIFVMERRWRALGAFVAIGAVLALASVALAGWPLHAAMLAKLSAISGNVLVSRISVGLELGLFELARIFGAEMPAPVDVAGYLYPEPGWITWALRGALVAGLFAIWGASRRLGDRHRLWVRLLATMLLAALVNPLAWIHYLLLPLLLLPGLVRLTTPARAVRMIGYVAVVLSMPVFLAASNLGLSDPLYAMMSLAVTLGLFAALLLLARAEA